MNAASRIPSVEVVPLAERMRYMLGFRLVLVPVVALVTWLSSEDLEATATAIALVTVAYISASVVGHVIWRAARRGGLAVFTLMLLTDGVYLAWTSYATG